MAARLSTAAAWWTFSIEQGSSKKLTSLLGPCPLCPMQSFGGHCLQLAGSMGMSSLGEDAIRKLLELEPYNGENYVSLSNITGPRAQVERGGGSEGGDEREGHWQSAWLQFD